MIDYEGDGVEWQVPLADIAMTVQIVGTFGSATCVIQGTNEATPTNWVGLKNAKGDAISHNSAGLDTFMDIPRWIRPHISGGSPATDINVIVLFRRETK